MRTRSTAIPLAFAAALTLAQPAAAGRKSWNEMSRVGEVALIAASLGVPAVKGDWSGALQAGGSVGAAYGATQLLKEAFPERRPDGSDKRSFPSNHTSLSFAAAASLHNRYGWEMGLPALAVASFVGLARVEAKKHHWYDVVAGAALGSASGYLITTRHDEKVRFTPWADSKGGGLSIAMRF